MESVPLAVLAASMLGWDRLLLAVFLKWWTIWFTLGRDFSRTSLLTLSAVSVGSACCWLLLASGAVGVAGAATAGELLGAVPFIWLAQAGVEALLLRQWMRRLAIRRWSWSRYDLVGLLFAHGIVVSYAAWRGAS